MKQYEEYKDSQIQWVGCIPSHWEERKAKYVFLSKKSVVGDKADKYDLLSLTLKGVIKRDMENPTGKFPTSFESYQEVNKGDFVFCLFDNEETPRTVGLSYFNGMITGAYDVLENTDSNVLSKFLLYYYLTIDDSKLMKPLYKGLRKTIPFDSFKRYRIPLPPLAEQEKIVSFLESKTLSIDAYVAERERERELLLLNKLKESEIANVITRGLNPDVKMKDSGIPWIGMIPEHWDVVRIKAILSESKEKTDADGGTLLSLSQYTGVTLKENAKKVGMFEAETTVGYNIVHPGQFVMNIMLAWNGSYAVSDYEGVISPAYCVFNFNVDCEKKYFHYLLRLPAYAGAFKTQSKGIIESRLRLYPQYFLSFKTVVPPIEEQKAIVAYIEDKCNKINSLISELEAEIEYLKEYKQKLIADCVTGQINVQSEI